MKITNFVIIACASVCMFVSCQNDDENAILEDRIVEMTFGVQMPNSSATRAHKDDERFVWDKGDHISIFAQGHADVSGHEFTFVQYEDKLHQGVFKGSSWDIGNDKYYWGLYPAQSDAKLVGSTQDAYVECTIPTQQKAYNNTFDPAACIQVGTASKGSGIIQLENVCTFFYVTVGRGCSGIKLSAVDTDWHLSGKVQVQASSSGAPIRDFVGNNQNYVELTDIPKEGGTFYLACVPSTHGTPALSVEFIGSWPVTFELKSKQAFQAGHLYNLGDYTEEYKKVACYCTEEGCECNPQSPCGHPGCYCGGGK